ncbi:transcriptional repressor [Pelomyxa schiedti]|nr:transcriptional repressor [Pelomyxa schiedti]
MNLPGNVHRLQQYSQMLQQQQLALPPHFASIAQVLQQQTQQQQVQQQQQLFNYGLAMQQQSPHQMGNTQAAQSLLAMMSGNPQMPGSRPPSPPQPTPPPTPPTNPLKTSGNFSARTPEPSADPGASASTPKTSDFSATLPFQPVTSAVQQVLNTIAGKVKLYSLTLEHIKTTQKHVLDLPPIECASNLETLSRQHKELYDAMLQEHATLMRIFDEIVLSPGEVFHTKKLELQLQKCMKQLDLYQLELMHYVRPDSIPCPAALMITEQPFSRSIVKGQMVPVEAQLLLPSRIEIRSMGRVTADIVQYHSTAKKNGKPTGPYLENATEDLDNEGKVRLHLRFPIGTNKKPVTLRLHVNIKHAPMKCHNPALAQPGVRLVESNQSRPFIITTNSIQWRDSEGILLKMDSFGEMMEISWARFANTLQTYYLAATRQHSEFPTRPLTLKDFDYLSNLKFEQSKIVNLPAFDRFWEWFGPGLEKVRHQKNMCPMWVKGYIYGFISKVDCDALLASHEEGSFVIRFSDRFPGKYATAYVYQGEVHHSLVKDIDSAGNKRTLVDFLHEVDNVRTLLQYKSDFTGKVQVSRIPKEEILQEFFTEKQEARTPGYEELPRSTFRSMIPIATTSTTTTSTAAPPSPQQNSPSQESPCESPSQQNIGSSLPPMTQNRQGYNKSY